MLKRRVHVHQGKQNFQTSQGFKETSTFKPLNENEIAEFVRNCHSKNIPIEIRHRFAKVGRNFQSEKLIDLSNYSGIIKYEPEELYIKVKPGHP